MKKIWALSSLLLASSTLFAGGFYAGVSGGYQILTNSIGGIGNEFEADDAVNFYTYSNDFSATTEGSGIIGSLFLGYEQAFANKWMLGVEFNAEVMNNHDKQYDSGQLIHNTIPRIAIINGYISASEDVALGITVRPGLLFKNSARIYGILGYEAARFIAGDSYLLQEFTDLTALSASTGHKWLNGFRYGLGTQFDVSERLALRLEINETQYAKVTTGSYYNLSNGLPDSESGGLAFKFRTTETSLGLVYKFDQPTLAVSNK